MVEFVTSTLSSVGVPVSFQVSPAGATTPSQYVTFLEYFTGADLEAADKEVTTERLIQVNVWSKSNYTQLVNNVRTTLEQAGFERTSEFDGPYSDGDSHFNKVLRFKFVDEY
ncbi:hypothetical protein A8F94_17475 [Bacillus sp. FJAT-27225]|nr:hypothetical protein A8F94_17475 [Bacillus sp. FJAT-27225]